VEPTRAERFEVLFRENHGPLRAYALRRTSREAARAVGCTRGAFAVRLHRARGRLAAGLAALERPVPTVTTSSLEVS
jgi:hypothetical protein